MDVHPAQVEREKAHAEVVFRYQSQDKTMSASQRAALSNTFLRQEILKGLKPVATTGDPAQPEGTDILTLPLLNFRRELAKLLRITPETEETPELPTAKRKTGRPLGVKHSFRQLWIKLGLSLEKEAFHQDADLFFLITLYTLIDETLKRVTEEEAIAGKVKDEAADDLADTLTDREDDNDDEEETDDVIDEECYSISQQTFYANLWEALALELATRRERESPRQKDTKEQTSYFLSGKTWHSTERIIKAFNDNQGIEVNKALEFALTLVDVVNTSFEEKWFDFALETRKIKHLNSEIKVIRPAPPLLQRIKALRAEELTLSHQAPLIERPLDWGPYGISRGGYHFRTLPFFKFHWKNQKIREFLDKINEPDWFTEVFAATNALQQTAWCINRRVWEVVEICYELAGVQIAALRDATLFAPKTGQHGTEEGPTAAVDPANDHEADLPPNALREQLDALTPKQRNAWMKWLKSEDNFYHRRGGRPKGPGAQITYRVVLSTLLDALPRPEIFYAYQADARGRLYPLGSILHPQGDDLNRALLEFADALPLTAAGVRPLAIYGSQQIKDDTILQHFRIEGRDKPTLDERVAWIEAHSEQIVRCAANPLGETWWRGSDGQHGPQVSKPFTFLAFCFAWADYQRYGELASCALPVHVDGTCNGLQHIGALMRDRSLATATNVLPSPLPRDIYSEVASAVRDRMVKPAIRTKAANKSPLDLEMARRQDESAREFFTEFSQLVNRALAKSVVMIIPYGAGVDEYRASIHEKLREKILPKKGSRGYHYNEYAQWIMAQPHFPAMETALAHKKLPAQKLRYRALDLWIRNHAAFHLTYHFNKAVREKYPNIHLFKQRLMTSIKPLLAQDIPALWVAPSGLPVLQKGFKYEKSEVNVQVLNSVRFRIKKLTNDVQKSKQRSGILPNFIHSLDAAHLVKTLLRAQTEGISAVSTVHDSFATHACHVDLLGVCLREAFCEIYPPGEDRLCQFEAWCHQLAMPPDHPRPPALTPTEHALLDLAQLWRAEHTTTGSETTAGATTEINLAQQTLPTENLGRPPRETTQTPGDDFPAPEEDWIEQVKESAYFFA